MQIEEHGGSCCGVSHIHNFGRWTESEERRLKTMIEDVLSAWDVAHGIGRSDIYGNHTRFRKPSHLFEIVLTDGQCVRGEWPEALKRLGFRHVARWFNSNSGNYCNMFVWNRAARTKRPWQGRSDLS